MFGNLHRVGDLAAGDVLLGHHVARRPGQELVLCPLHAVLAGSVDVDIADQLSGECRARRRPRGWIDPLRLRQQTDAGQCEDADGVGDHRLHAPPEPDPGFPSGEP